MKKLVIIPLFVLGLLLSGSSSTVARPYSVFGGFIPVGPCTFYFIIIYDDNGTPTDPTDDVRLASGWISDCPGGPNSTNGLIQNDNDETDALFPSLSGLSEPGDDLEEFAPASESMTLYPNPATQEINIALQSAQPVSGFITNTLGVIIKNLSFGDDLSIINVSDMSPGNYVLRILGDDDKIYVEQFVVQ